MILTKCYICSERALPVTSLGVSPKSNFYAHSYEVANEETFPLELFSCADCGHLQLKNYISPERLFTNYSYVSGTTHTLKEYFGTVARCSIEALRPSEILDVASNDGSFLKTYLDFDDQRELGLTGIDPAENLRAAYPSEINIVTGFLNESTNLNGKFDFISAQNVVAHTPDPISLLRGIEQHMHNDSVLFLQTSQAFMLPECQFDTVYHEHYSYFSLRSVRAALDHANLRIARTLIADIHGQSLVNIVLRKEARQNKAEQLASQLLKNKFFRELTPGEQYLLNEPESFLMQLNRFDQQISQMKHAFRLWIDERPDSKIILVGSAAKAVTWMITVGLAPYLIVDENPSKIGKYLPNCERPIIGMDELDIENAILIIGAWNFYDEIKTKLIEKGLGEKNNVIVKFFPRFESEEI
jgi:2-polyprenyl-3-methyl-5-hydroxy-6-metoxy-1,4-benzoquinol methylase